MREIQMTRRVHQAGFTLTEMLIVIALIGIVATLVGGNVIGKFNSAKVDATKIQMKQLGVILDDFNRVCGFYPSTEQGLDALLKAPVGRECKNYDPAGFIKGGKIPKDGWGNDFVYESDGAKYKLISLGADNKPGGDGNNKDLDSDEL
ncbi:type II secretion system protein GspG [bacterium]|nr:type II secretion system protein GspG [bacterium]